MLIIITEGSPELGAGHLRRSATLAATLADRAPVRLWVLETDAAQMSISEVQDWFSGLSWEHGAAPRFHAGEVAILDLEPASHRRMWELCAQNGVPCLALDYFDPARLPDLTINLLDHSGAMRAACAAAGIPGSYHEGPGYALIRPSIRARRTPPAASAIVRRVLVSMGGADPRGRTLEAANLLARHTGAQVTVVLGPLVSGALETQVRAAAPANFSVVRNPASFEELLAEADVVLTSGGTTLLEALCLGKPVIAFPQNDGETAHAAQFVEKGACAWADSLPRVFEDAGLRRSMAEKAARELDGRGVERVAAVALELCKRRHSP